METVFVVYKLSSFVSLSACYFYCLFYVTFLPASASSQNLLSGRLESENIRSTSAPPNASDVTLLHVDYIQTGNVTSDSSDGDRQNNANNNLESSSFAGGDVSNSVDTEKREQKVPASTNGNGNATTTNNLSIQIYLIVLFGLTPAALGAFCWFAKRLKRRCMRNKTKKAAKTNALPSAPPDPFSIEHNKIGEITYKIIERAEKLNQEAGGPLWYNSYRPSSFIKSRRVYSLEIPRKHLEMLEVLGEGESNEK